MPTVKQRFFQRVQGNHDHALADKELDSRLRLAPLTPEELQKLEELSVLHSSTWEHAYTLGMTVSAWKQYLEMHPDLQTTLNTARARGARGLRVVQMRAALEGNTTMQIWLGRAILNQNKDSSLTTETSLQITDISEEAKQHLAELTSVIYNSPTLRQQNPIDVESSTSDSNPENVQASIVDLPPPGAPGLSGHHAVE
jgi:hypothetical protein